jgi:hypothetical protein
MYSVIKETCDTFTEINEQCDVWGSLSVRDNQDNQWRVEELQAEPKVALENITEEISTTVMDNIKVVVQMLFDKHDNIFNVFYA